MLAALLGLLAIASNAGSILGGIRDGMLATFGTAWFVPVGATLALAAYLLWPKAPRPRTIDIVAGLVAWVAWGAYRHRFSSGHYTRVEGVGLYWSFVDLAWLNLYPFIYLRLDLLSVFLAVLGIALVRRRHQYGGGAVLAIACFAKLWPLVLVPVLIVRRAWRALAAFAGVGVAGTAAWVAWGGIDGPKQVLTFRGAKGWEFESTVGALVRSVGGVTPRIERGAWRVGEVTTVVSGLLALALLAGVAMAWVLASRAKPRGTAVLDGLAPMAAITVFLVFSPLLSPQFLLWLLPFAAIAAAHGERLVTGLVLVVCALSTALLALLPELIHGGTFALFVLISRNAVLVALLATLAIRLMQSTGWRRAPSQLEPVKEIAA